MAFGKKMATERQIRFGDSLGINVRNHPSRIARKMIAKELARWELERAREKGIESGILVLQRRPGGEIRLGKVRYVRIPEGELRVFDDGRLVVGVDWLKPRRFFSRCSTTLLTVADIQSSSGLEEVAGQYG